MTEVSFQPSEAFIRKVEQMRAMALWQEGEHPGLFSAPRTQEAIEAEIRADFGDEAADAFRLRALARRKFREALEQKVPPK